MPTPENWYYAILRTLAGFEPWWALVYRTSRVLRRPRTSPGQTDVGAPPHGRSVRHCNHVRGRITDRRLQQIKLKPPGARQHRVLEHPEGSGRAGHS